MNLLTKVTVLSSANASEMQVKCNRNFGFFKKDKLTNTFLKRQQNNANNFS